MNFLKQRQICCPLEFHSLPFIECQLSAGILHGAKAEGYKYDPCAQQKQTEGWLCWHVMLIQQIEHSDRKLDKWPWSGRAAQPGGPGNSALGKGFAWGTEGVGLLSVLVSRFLPFYGALASQKWAVFICENYIRNYERNSAPPSSLSSFLALRTCSTLFQNLYTNDFPSSSFALLLRALIFRATPLLRYLRAFSVLVFYSSY